MSRLGQILLIVVTTSIVHVLSLSLFWGSPDAHSSGAPSGNGDVNGDRLIDVSDPIYLLDYIFNGGTPPVSIASGGSMAWTDGPGSVTTVDQVGIGTTTPTAPLTVDGPIIRQIARATGLGPQTSVNVGPPTMVPNRALTFVKTDATTAIRVSYTDTIRARNLGGGGGMNARCEIRVNGAAPPGGRGLLRFLRQ